MTTEATEAPALAVLRRQLDERWPQRSHVADRILGRDGDHARGDAIDVTYDATSGPDLDRLAAVLLRDQRTAVVMWRSRIAEPGVAGGAWRPYAGGAEGSHAGHLHLSVEPARRGWEAPWQLESAEGETGDVFWPFDSERAKRVRRAQREYLRGTWVRDTPLGDFLRLDEPDESPAAPASPEKVRPSPGWENYERAPLPLVRLLDTDTGSQLEQGGKEAAAGAAIGAAVGSVLEVVPVFGPILHAASVVLGALGGFLAGMGRDTFHPDAMTAAGWLALFNLLPGMLFTGVDTIDVGKGEERAARLVRYFLLVSGTVPPAGPLYNPNSDRTDNPYMQKVDPRFPQTNPRHNRQIKVVAAAGRPTPPEVATPLAAQGLLALLRKVLGPSGVMQWDQAKAHMPMLRRNLKHVRALAGETGRDPNLETLFGGDVSPVLSYPLARGVHVPAGTRYLPTARLATRPVRRETGETGEAGAPIGLLIPVRVFVEGMGEVALNEYVARVVTAEMGGSREIEALMALAIVARTFVSRAMQDDPKLGTAAKPAPNRGSFLVASKDAKQLPAQAADATSGGVATHMGRFIPAYFVAGGAWPKGAWDGKGTDADTEQYVTYNHGRSGASVVQTSLSHRDNRGCMSQNGAGELARRGWKWPAILRFFYGNDLRFTIPEPLGQSAGAEPSDAGAPAGPVIIYGASWCGPCHRAADYLRDRGVPFLLKDIEQIVGARAEMVEKLSRAGLQPRAIPVLDVGDRIVVGFDKTRLDEALAAAGFAATPPPTAGARTHEVTRAQAYTANVMGTYAVAEEIARLWGALDRAWFSELMQANLRKARDKAGYWKALGEGEILWIPDSWPEPLAGPRKKIVIPPETGRIDDEDSFPTPGFPRGD